MDPKGTVPNGPAPEGTEEGGEGDCPLWNRGRKGLSPLKKSCLSGRSGTGSGIRRATMQIVQSANKGVER